MTDKKYTPEAMVFLEKIGQSGNSEISMKLTEYLTAILSTKTSRDEEIIVKAYNKYVEQCIRELGKNVTQTEEEIKKLEEQIKKAKEYTQRLNKYKIRIR